jgi:hypothetical protein
MSCTGERRDRLRGGQGCWLIALAVAALGAAACVGGDGPAVGDDDDDDDDASGADGGARADAGERGDGDDAAIAVGDCPEGYPAGELADKPTVSATVNGHGPYVLIYDTGAPRTVIDTSVRAVVGGGPYTVEVAGQTLSAYALEVASIAQTFGIAGADGIIGADLVGDLVVTVDRARARIWLDEVVDEPALAACAHVAPGARWLDLEVADYLYVQGRVEDVDGWFLVDSGATLGAVNQSVFDDLQRRHPRPALTGFHTSAGIGSFWAMVAAVGAMEVGDGALRVEHITVRSVPDDILPPPPATGAFLGLLPNGFLAHFLMSVDHRGRRIRLAPFAGDSMREPSFLYTVGIGLEAEVRTPPRVGVVLDGSAAAAAGIDVGDEVLAIDDVGIEAYGLDQRAWSLVSATPGAVIGVTVAGAGGVRTLALEVEDLLGDP